MNNTYYKVMIRFWSYFDEYKIGEYSGVEHFNHLNAVNELKRALYEYGEDNAWIEKVVK